MVFIRRIFFSLIVILVSVEAEVPSCRIMKQSATQCNPYDLSFLEATQLKKRAASLRHRPITEKTLLVTEKIRVKNGMTLHSLINKYIRREERLYYKVEKEKELLPKQETNLEEFRKTSKKKEEANASSRPAPAPKKKTVQEKKNKIAKQNMQPQKPLEVPKIVLLTPKTKSPVPREAEQNASEKQQPPSEEILPAELLPDKQEKQAEITPDIKAAFAVYEVKKGDSLIGIAKRFWVETGVLVEINRLHKGIRLKKGQKLHIPLSQEDVDAIDSATYIVKKGDTLSKIAKHFHVTVKNLKKYNRIRKKSVIHVGQVLVLPLPRKLLELKRIEEQKRKAALKKKRERERLARIALKKAERARFLKTSRSLKRKLSVTATAYTSHRSQTDKTPFLAAWNNRIRPGMKVIAVSRDLITKYGITNGKKVRISGLPGIYTVRDKMNKKWRRKIDIYMGTSRWRALRWGRRRVTLYY